MATSSMRTIRGILHRNVLSLGGVGVGTMFRARGGGSSSNAVRYASYTAAFPKRNGDVKFEFDESRKFLTHKCESPQMYSYANKEEMVKYFKDMFTIRRLELVADQYYKGKKIWGFCHLYDGQEAICVGIEAGLKRGDHIITAYRDHGFQYTRGDTVRGIFAEMFGKSTGCARGKGGSMHLYFPSNRFYGGNGIVGAQIPVGTGVGFAIKYKGVEEVMVAAMGDGAANQGQVYESYNMAKLWNLPVIYLVENNQYGMGTSIDRASAVTQFYTRGDYIPGIQVDGMNVLAVREATRYARNHCVSGKGPIILEAMTYRYHGHSMSDPGISYRSSDEVQEYRSRFDPIRKVRNWIIESKWMDEAELKALEGDIRKQVESEAKEAEGDGMLKKPELVTDIYFTGPPPFVRYGNYADSIIDGKRTVREVYPEYA